MMEDLVIDCAYGVALAAFGSVEDARAAVPAVLAEAVTAANEPAEEDAHAAVQGAEGAQATGAPQGGRSEKERRQMLLNFDVQEAARRGGYKKVAIPRDKDVCRALFALMVTLLLPNDKVERSVENAVHRFSLRGKKKVESAVKFLVEIGLIETNSKRKRTYYALSQGAREALCREEVQG